MALNESQSVIATRFAKALEIAFEARKRAGIPESASPESSTGERIANVLLAIKIYEVTGIGIFEQ